MRVHKGSLKSCNPVFRLPQRPCNLPLSQPNRKPSHENQTPAYLFTARHQHHRIGNQTAQRGITCPIGGEKFTAAIDATGSFSLEVVDTRPFRRFATPLELAQCPSNQFVMFKDELSPAELAKFARVVGSAEYQQIPKH